MQVATPPRLHWIPVEPSWLVAIGLILLAVLPHQIPPLPLRILRHPLGAALLLLVAAAIGAWYKKPVLGIALLLLVAAVQIRARAHPREGFAAPILVKDRSPKNHANWFVEDTLGEDPHGTQERTEDGGFLYDEVEGPSRPWFVESSLNERPVAVQERTVAVGDPHDTPYETGHAVQPVA
jgi:hypothetical protein